MDKFSVGEIAILVSVQNPILYDKGYVGTECEVVSLTPSCSCGLCHCRIRLIDGSIRDAGFDNLRKKRPPREDVTDWGEIEKDTGWSPRKAFVPLLAERYGRG